MKLNSFFATMLACSTALPTHAAVTTYTNRAAFVAATGALNTETFNAATGDTSIQSPALFGVMSVVSYGTQSGGNFIDTPPHQIGAWDIDGTTYLRASTTADSGLEFTFARPIMAWGADFVAFQDDLWRSHIDVSSTTLTPPPTLGNSKSYYGFSSTVPFTSVKFTGTIVGDGFAIDNISYELTNSTVPEPASWALLIVGFGLIGASFRSRRYAAARI